MLPSVSGTGPTTSTQLFPRCSSSCVARTTCIAGPPTLRRAMMRTIFTEDYGTYASVPSLCRVSLGGLFLLHRFRRGIAKSSETNGFSSRNTPPHSVLLYRLGFCQGLLREKVLPKGDVLAHQFFQ